MTTSSVSAKSLGKLEKAMELLLEGRPRVTDGALTKNNLFREAGVGRATMNRATDLLARWDKQVQGASHPSAATRQAKDSSSQMQRDLGNLRREITALKGKLATAATVIAVLHAENVELRENATVQRNSRLAALPSIERADSGKAD